MSSWASPSKVVTQCWRASSSTSTSPPWMDGKKQTTHCENRAKCFSAKLQKVQLRWGKFSGTRNDEEPRHGRSVRNDLSGYLLFLQTTEDVCLTSGNTFDLDSLSCQRRKEITRIFLAIRWLWWYRKAVLKAALNEFWNLIKMKELCLGQVKGRRNYLNEEQRVSVNT